MLEVLSFIGGFITCAIVLFVASVVIAPRLMSNPKIMAKASRMAVRRMMSNGKPGIPNS